MLVVEDAPEVRRRLVELLGTEGEADVVGHASDVPSALAAARLLRPSLVVLDARLPGGSGLDVLRTLRAEGATARVAVLTQHATAQARHAYLSAGADHFFDKASDIPLLLAVAAMRSR